MNTFQMHFVDLSNLSKNVQCNYLAQSRDKKWTVYLRKMKLVEEIKKKLSTGFYVSMI